MADNDEIGRTLLAWAIDELAAWRLNRLNRDATAQALHVINQTSPSVYLYTFRSGSVWLADKPADLAQIPTRRGRALHYLRFFQSLCPLLPPGFSETIALDPGDKLGETVDVPVFCFQKRRGTAQILLPDIDFLINDFYEKPTYQDSVAYADKSATAIFVGGTSGGMISAEIARDCTLPRLRAARFFHGHPRVDFFLPHVVQTRTDEARDILRAYPFCQPLRIWWQEQFSRRFLLSMDGNGATCSRVAIALSSNSVLLKYQSDDLLYYFRYLQPWLHYIPVRGDAEVEKILDLEQDLPAHFAAIAAAGRQFAQSFLTRKAVTLYMAQLLVLYSQCFADSSAPGEADVAAAAAEMTEPGGNSGSERPVTACAHFSAHIQNRGDTLPDATGWVGAPGSGKAVEGFLLSFDDADLNQHFTVRSVGPDGGLDDPTPGGNYCGTKGQNRPIYGFVIDILSKDRGLPGLLYEAAFLDGFRSDLLRPGSPCLSPSRAPLLAMRILVSESGGHGVDRSQL